MPSSPKRPRWSKPRRLFGTKHHLELRQVVGVYRIRALGSDGRTIKFQRLAGVDRSGILHIGKSKNLGVRIQRCRQACEGLQAPHQAGQQYAHWRFKRQIPMQQLWYDYVVTQNDFAALALERQLHEKYRRRFLDRPPLDGTSGQRD